MTTSQKLSIKASEIRQKLNELASLDAPTAENLAEIEKLRGELTATETQYRAAVEAEGAETREAERTEGNAGGDTADPEMRERLELRGRAQVSEWFRAWTRGGFVTGAEAELVAAAGVQENTIPFDMWENAQPVPYISVSVDGVPQHRAATPAPSTVGINLDPIRPAVFAPSIASRIGIDMPRVSSGTFATGTITTSQTATALAKGAAATATAGAITVQSGGPKRVSARLELRIEDIMAVGQANFEAALRENLSLVMSAELDDQMINGDGTGDNLSGMFVRLTDPTAPAAGVETFDRMLRIAADGIDGLWATEMMHINQVVGVDTFRLAARTFRDAAGQDLGDKAYVDYAKAYTGGYWCNSRMPPTASNVQAGILYRSGRMLEGGMGGMRTAVCGQYGSLSVDDVYTGSASATRYYTIHALLTDVFIVQAGAYAQTGYRVST